MKTNGTKHRRQAKVAALLSAALIASQGPWGALKRAHAGESPGNDTYQTVLGEALNYGIVTEDFDLRSGDAQTNVATVVGTSMTQTGNDLTNPVEQPFILANVEDEFGIKGEPAYVFTNEEDADKVVGKGTRVTLDTMRGADELEAEVRELLDHGASQSRELATRPETADVEYRKDSQKHVIDVLDQGPGTHYVSMDEDTYDKVSAEASKLQIHKRDDQTIVLSVEGDAERMHKFDLNGRGADSYLGEDAGAAPQTLIWNFPDATQLKIEGSVTGVVLAPQADVTVTSTSSGWLMAEGVTIGSGEWHNVFQQVDFERPVYPDDPVGPDAPVTPGDPVVPDAPEDPTVPEQPEEPEVPSVPDAPEDPSVPDAPEDPSVPDAPEDPSLPDHPGVPEQPGVPESPEEPSVPELPEEPESPEVPGVPEEPVAPEVPEEPVTPELPESPDLPDGPGPLGNQGDVESGPGKPMPEDPGPNDPKPENPTEGGEGKEPEDDDVPGDGEPLQDKGEGPSKQPGTASASTGATPTAAGASPQPSPVARGTVLQGISAGAEGMPLAKTGDAAPAMVALGSLVIGVVALLTGLRWR